MKFADKLRSLRETKTLSRKQLANDLDVSVPTIISWERGDRIPPLPVLQKICRALGVKCTVFDGCDFGGAEEKPGRGRPKKS